MKIYNPSTGGVADEIDGDPRLSESQRAALLKAAESDREAEVIGMDGLLRPVVRARLGGAKRSSEYALMRGGQPTSVTTPLVEIWNGEER